SGPASGSARRHRDQTVGSLREDQCATSGGQTMMRLRGTPIIATLSLLISVGTADAQSAWGLWHHDYLRSWEPTGTWPTRQECLDNRPRFRVPSDGTLLVSDRVPGWCCLPDTMDVPAVAKVAADTVAAKGSLDALSAKDRDDVLGLLTGCW